MNGDEPAIKPYWRKTLSPEAKYYRKETSALDKQMVDQLYREEKSKEHHEQDHNLFFNKSDAKADFDFWSKAAHWTLNEAIALTFGKDPRVVTCDRVEDMKFCESPFVEKFIELRDLTDRAKTGKKLFDPVLPGNYIAWARQNDIPFPLELADMVVARGNDIPNWKKAYDDLLAQKEEYSRQVKLLLEKRDKDEKLLEDRIVQLELDLANSQKQNTKTTEKSLSTRERETLLNIIIGISSEPPALSDLYLYITFLIF
jgi:hypothetical protein